MTNIEYSLLYHPVFLLILMVEFVLKGMALWRAGRNNQSGWFVFLFIIASGGILPLIYLLFFQKKRKEY